jgi:hypothetical protein
MEHGSKFEVGFRTFWRCMFQSAYRHTLLVVAFDCAAVGQQTVSYKTRPAFLRSLQLTSLPRNFSLIRIHIITYPMVYLSDSKENQE